MTVKSSLIADKFDSSYPKNAYNPWSSPSYSVCKGNLNSAYLTINIIFPYLIYIKLSFYPSLKIVSPGE